MEVISGEVFMSLLRLNCARFEAARFKDPNRHIALQSGNATSWMLDSRACLA